VKFNKVFKKENSTICSDFWKNDAGMTFYMTINCNKNEDHNVLIVQVKHNQVLD
jgi:hypothetical protein